VQWFRPGMPLRGIQDARAGSLFIQANEVDVHDRLQQLRHVDLRDSDREESDDFVAVLYDGGRPFVLRKGGAEVCGRVDGDSGLSGVERATHVGDEVRSRCEVPVLDGHGIPGRLSSQAIHCAQAASSLLRLMKKCFMAGSSTVPVMQTFSHVLPVLAGRRDHRHRLA
jgi:hypothetical protein